MAHAAVIRVKLEADSDIDHRHSILMDYVIPEAKALPGFQKGMWMNDGAGTGILVFDSEPNAKSAITSMTREGGPPVVAVGVHVVEIEA